MWFIFALSAGFLFAINRLIVRTIAQKDDSSPLSIVILHNLLAGVLLAPFALINMQQPKTAQVWLFVALVSIFIFLADYFATKSLSKIETSLFLISNQVRHFFVVIGAAIWFAEALSSLKAIAILVLISGVAIVVLEKNKLKLSSGVLDAMLSGFFISVASLLVKQVSSDISSALLASIALVGSGILGYALLKFNPRPLQKTYRRARSRLLAAIAIFALFEFLFFAALDIGEASLVTPVTQSSLVFTVIGGYIFLNERKHMQRKIAGCICIAVAILIIYIIA